MKRSKVARRTPVIAGSQVYGKDELTAAPGNFVYKHQKKYHVFVGMDKTLVTEDRDTALTEAAKPSRLESITKHMAANLPRSERPRKPKSTKSSTASQNNLSKSVHSDATAVSASAPKLTREQRYAAPVERHSQQTQRRARENAAAGGHATEKEQMAHERNVAEASFVQRTQQQQKQREQKSSPKAAAQPVAPAAKPE